MFSSSTGAVSPTVLGAQSTEGSFHKVKSITTARAKQFAEPISLADRQWTEDELVAIKRNYEDYSRVVFAMGGFFFSTGMQWSFWISQSTNAEERRGLCHHNAQCNLAPDDSLDWMGLNPDMVWSNAVYLVAGAFIMLAAAKHHTEDAAECQDSQAPLQEFELQAAGDENVPNTSHPPAAASGRWSRWGCGATAVELTATLLRRSLVGKRGGRCHANGLFGHYLTGMYFLTGSAIFVEGLLSSLYHTCPSKSFSQFDYIGITTCEVAIFLMMWSKCHPKLPSAGSFALYLAALGMLSAIEVSLTLPNRPWAWAILWVCMVFLVPPVAVTMHFSLDHFCTPAELIYVIKRSSTQKMEFTKQSVAIFAAVLFVTVVQVGSVGLDTDWYGRLIILGMWCAFVLLAVLITFLIRRFVADEDPVTDIASDAELATRQRSWRPVRVGVYLLWWFMGFNTCLNGILYPNKHTLSHGIMQWHGKGAMLYYLYFCGGLLYFKLVSWHPLKFMRLAFYTVVMIGCGLAGGNYFVNGSYKANAEVRSYGIPCENDGAGDDSFCTQAYNSTLDGDYPCGYRDGRYICLVGSLDYNMACATGSLDGHSLWHVFSAIALFVLPLSVMVIDDLVEKPRHLIAVL